MWIQLVFFVLRKNVFLNLMTMGASPLNFSLSKQRKQRFVVLKLCIWSRGDKLFKGRSLFEIRYNLSIRSSVSLHNSGFLTASVALFSNSIIFALEPYYTSYPMRHRMLSFQKYILTANYYVAKQATFLNFDCSPNRKAFNKLGTLRSALCLSITTR